MRQSRPSDGQSVSFLTITLRDLYSSPTSESPSIIGLSIQAGLPILIKRSQLSSTLPMVTAASPGSLYNLGNSFLTRFERLRMSITPSVLTRNLQCPHRTPHLYASRQHANGLLSASRHILVKLLTLMRLLLGSSFTLYGSTGPLTKDKMIFPV